jgi:hypothetical protein
MDTTDFAILVGRLERDCDRSPRNYALRVALVAALGYLLPALLAIGAVLSLIFVLIAAVAGRTPDVWAIACLVVAASLLVATLRSLSFDTAPPSGRDVGPDDAPGLFAAIDELVQKMSTSRNGTTTTAAIHWVTLDREFGLALRQCARRGVFGGYVNHLQIGVPLLMALSIAEFKTVLAHEIGHLGAAHNRFSSWIYRLRTSWLALLPKFDTPETLWDRALATIYARYIPYFHAYTFVMARNHEYAADRAAARATNNRVLGRALVKLALIGRFLAEVFWRRLFDEVEKVPEPQYMPYAVMPRALTFAQKEWQRSDWLHASLRSYDGEDEVHPGLGERLAALDVPPEMPTHVAEKTALSLLGDATAVVKWCDEQWREEYVPAWRKRHETIREAHWKIAQYENAAEADLKTEDLWQKASLLLDVAREHEAIETLQTLVARDEKAAQAQFLLGRLLLEHGDERGLQHLTLAARSDPELLDAVGELGYGYLIERGRRGEAQRFWDRVSAA